MGYSIALFNKGVEAYNKNDLQRAETFYKKIFEIVPLDKDNNLKRNNITADLVSKNLYMVANKAKDYPKAKMYLQKLIDAKYNDPMIYIYMSRCCWKKRIPPKRSPILSRAGNFSTRTQAFRMPR
jgi:tetratricopeptide (TPR) repeat protein